jgi:hypothetical protein
VDPQGREADSEELDEVSRQRNKRKAGRASQPVPGLRGITVGQLAEAAAGATEAPDADHVTEFLRSRGHTDQTVESVLRCLDLDPSSQPVQDCAVGSLAETSSGPQRLRTLAQLQAMLLDD